LNNLRPQIQKEKTIARNLISQGNRDELRNRTNKPTLKTLCRETLGFEAKGNKIDLIDLLLSMTEVRAIRADIRDVVFSMLAGNC
jgi:hypothetical protein